jgi:hypothetical protein
LDTGDPDVGFLQFLSTSFDVRDILKVFRYD